MSKKKHLAPPIGEDLEAWIDYYEKKTGRPFRYAKNEQLLFDPQKGFVTYGHSPEDEALFLGKAAGDGKYWETVLNDLAKLYGYKKGLWICYRNPVPYMKKYGAKIAAFYLEREVR